MNRTLKLVAAASATLAAGIVQAAPPDTTAIVSEITNSVTPIGLVAAAVVTLVVAVKVYKYIKQAL